MQHVDSWSMVVSNGNICCLHRIISSNCTPQPIYRVKTQKSLSVYMPYTLQSSLYMEHDVRAVRVHIPVYLGFQGKHANCSRYYELYFMSDQRSVFSTRLCEFNTVGRLCTLNHIASITRCLTISLVA